MSNKHMARNFLLLVVGLGCGTSSLQNQPATVGDSSDRRETITWLVDGEDLRADERNALEELFDELPSPCDASASLTSCGAASSQCRSACRTAQRYMKRLLVAGYTPQEIDDAYTLRFGKDTYVDFKGLEGAPSKGKSKAPVTIVTFSDFQCPHCARAHEHIAAVYKKYPGKIRLVFLQFPLSEVHPFAAGAARASLAAHRQGKFWSFCDVLFEHQSLLSDAQIAELARRHGLDMEQFARDQNDKSIAAIVDADRRNGETVGVQGTPGIFINGRMYRDRHAQIGAYIADILAE